MRRSIALFVTLGVVAPIASMPACGKSASSSPPSSTDDAEAGLAMVPRAPSPRALRDLVGLATNPDDFPNGTDAGSVMHRAFIYDKLAEAGFHRIRRDFGWSEIEKTRGAFDFARYDTLVAEARAHGIEILATLDYGNPWATSQAGADDYYPPDDPSDFARFAGAVAAHFAGQLHDYEIWNEPNVGFRFWKPTLNGDAARFGALVLESTRAIASADAAARVAYGGTAYMELVRGPDFASSSFASAPGLAGALGAFAMHAYSIYPPTRGPESSESYEVPLLDKVATMSGVLATAGAPSTLPIWITEIGWPTTTSTSPDQQARFTVRALVLAALAGADGTFLYTMGDGPHPDADPPEDAFGLVGYHADFSDGQRPPDKPAFGAIKALLADVGAFAVKRRVPTQADDVYVVELSSSAATAWIYWSARAADGAAPVDVTLPNGATVSAGPDPRVAR